VYRAADGAEKELKIKPKKLQDVYDSEQLFYLLAAAVFRVKADAAQSSNSFKILNLYDHAIYNSGVVTFGYNVEEPHAVSRGEWGFGRSINAEGGGITPVRAGLPAGGMAGGFKGGAISAYYFTGSSLTIGDAAGQLERYRLIGYTQEQLDAQGTKRRSLEFLLKA